MIKVGIVGIFGRMGQALVKAIDQNPLTELVGGLCKEQTDNKNYSFLITQDIHELLTLSDVIIDFSSAESLMSHLRAVHSLKKPIIIGTTGFDAQTREYMNDVSKEVPILQSGNMSLGVNLLSKLVYQTGKILGDDWDIEITEAHHRHKIDAPSGTALLLGESAAQGRNADFEKVKKLSRQGIDKPRQRGEIGFSTIRAGSIIGEHTVLFAHDDELISLTHKANDRKIFANGAVYAATKIVSLSPKFYTMQDILPI